MSEYDKDYNYEQFDFFVRTLKELFCEWKSQ